MTAPRCSLSPWPCPCLVDKWVCEADGTQLQSAARMSHVYVHLADLLKYTKAPVDQHSLPPDTKALLPLTNRVLGFEMRCVHLIVHTDGFVGWFWESGVCLLFTSRVLIVGATLHVYS